MRPATQIGQFLTKVRKQEEGEMQIQGSALTLSGPRQKQNLRTFARMLDFTYFQTLIIVWDE
jgi:hypothetical protein